MSMLSYQHIMIGCESFMCLARGSLIPYKHTDGAKAWHDIVSTGKDQMALMLNDKCIADEVFFFFVDDTRLSDFIKREGFEK